MAKGLGGISYKDLEKHKAYDKMARFNLVFHTFDTKGFNDWSTSPVIKAFYFTKIK